MKFQTFIVTALLTPLAFAIPAQANHCGPNQSLTEVHTSGCDEWVLDIIFDGPVWCVTNLGECAGRFEWVIDAVNVVICTVDPNGRACP